MEHKIDLHNHGTIGFHPNWLRLQGYTGKNILQLWANQCFDNGISICAVTSQRDLPIIPRGHIEDRINILYETYARLLPENYEISRLGRNSFIVQRGNERVIFVSGQTARVKQDGIIFDTLVFGSNEVPNMKPWKETLEYCHGEGLIQIAEHPYSLHHFGIGHETLEEYLAYFDAIEGFNAQLALPKKYAKFRFLQGGMQELNDRATDFAMRHNKPYVATSDAHTIEDTGLAYISVQQEAIRTNDEFNLLSDLRKVIRNGNFQRYCSYPKLPRWFNWAIRFKIGCMMRFDSAE